MVVLGHFASLNRGKTRPRSKGMISDGRRESHVVRKHVRSGDLRGHCDAPLESRLPTRSPSIQM
ncbi:uncharacterized protein LOC143188561 isoform X3 [Calliopsis andreniformis]|uniref:uncharacterized protein LOC143188561 isoform X3 n=1 Tax=Calliopsis andreniformis TaxID=337506 RepID=UPI003FCCB90E